MPSTIQHQPLYPGRRLVVVILLAGMMLALVARAVYLQILNHEFLSGEGDDRQLRTVQLAAHRGIIADRHGEPLAVSTPVQSVWVDPRKFAGHEAQLPALARLLETKPAELENLIRRRAGREFVYLRRHLQPHQGEMVAALDVPGVGVQREYRRYYPTGEVAAHVVGFTNIDDHGQEGLELAFDQWLSGQSGSERIIRDGRRRAVAHVEDIRAPKPGRDLRLSLDRRLQYLAHQELKAAVLSHGARSGSAVLLKVDTGEVLAMVNQPAYNPNNRRRLRSDQFRNRAITDLFEPGSTVKPFIVAGVLENGLYSAGSVIDTSPGYYRVGRNMVRDVRNLGRIDLATVLRKSSNVGASKLATALTPEMLWTQLVRVGIGSLSGGGYPGEVSGVLSPYRQWYPIDHATLGYGYGLSVTTLQLARAYSVLAGDGMLRPVSFLRVDQPVAGEQALSARTAKMIRGMLETVVSREGTGWRAQVSGFRVAGKTGTVRKAQAGGYADDRYVALFAGMAPASRPALVLAVRIDEPTTGEYTGGKVAAPVFSRIMSGALRLLGIAPDDLPVTTPHLVAARTAS